MIGYFSKNTFLISCQRDIYDATFTGAQRYFMYSLILADIRAFQHSSMSIILRMPFKRRILAMKVSMIISVTTGRSTLFPLILSSSNTIKRLLVRSSSLSELSRNHNHRHGRNGSSTFRKPSMSKNPSHGLSSPQSSGGSHHAQTRRIR